MQERSSLPCAENMKSNKYQPSGIDGVNKPALAEQL